MSTDDERLYARNTDPDTSHEAAERLQITSYWYLIVAFLIANNRAEGWTDWEIQCALPGRLGLCPWHRVSDVRRKGWAAWAATEEGKPIKRPGESNRLRRASWITPSGIAWFEETGGGDHEH